MGEEITTIDISNAEELSASSFTNVKNSINIKIDNSGDLTDTNDNAVTMLNFGNRGDHCVTVINAELPSNFSEGYQAYFLVNLKNKTYIQKCLMEGNIAKALITKEISLDSQSTECLFALIEANATTGNLREQQEIFISDVFMGTVRSNFLDSNWMDADISISEDLTVLDKFETPNPDKYTSMIWVNGETKLNAANMNNIIKGIDELKERAVEANPTDEATKPLTKLKVGNTTYNFNETLEKNGIYSGVDGNSIFNGISVSAEEFEKIKNGVVRYIYGTYKSAEDQEATPYFASYVGKSYDGETTSYVFHYGDTTIDYGFLSVESINLIFQEYQGEIAGGIIINKSHVPSTPSLPSDASSKTYTLRSANSTLTWVDTSVGTQKFENVEVSGTITAGGKSLNAVEANPSDAATTSLNKIKIGNVVYNIVGSSSSGGSSGSDSSAGDSSFVAFEYNNIITNGRVNDGVFQNLTNLINAHKVPVIVGDQRTYSYSGMATSPDGSKNGLAFTAEVHMYDASSYTYFSGQLPLILWSDNSISEDAMAFGSIPTPPYDQTGTKQYVLSGTDIGLAWIDIDEKISSAITSTLEADY